MSNYDWRFIAAQEPPKWFGSLNDDCTALWAGFTLRAEWMYDEIWWWAVYDDEEKLGEIASSLYDESVCTNADSARKAAEHAARRWLGLPPRT